MNTSNQILLDAASFLEEEGKWNRGSYFKPLQDKPGCAMCAHGAIAYCGNPKVKIQIDKVRWAPMAADTATHAAEAGVLAVDDYWKRYFSNLASQEGLSLEDYLVKRFGQVGLAHYKAAQVGLTFDYNDNPGTTQQDVVRKLREAALL